MYRNARLPFFGFNHTGWQHAAQEAGGGFVMPFEESAYRERPG